MLIAQAAGNSVLADLSISLWDQRDGPLWATWYQGTRSHEKSPGGVPGVVPGSYRVIVRADLRNNIPETDEANNVMASADDVNVDVPVLTVGVECYEPLG